jgi:hypothetical protein
MKGPILYFTALCLAALLTSGCSKKNDDEDVEPGAPAAQATPAAPTEAPTAMDGREAQPQPAVSPEMAASDAAALNAPAAPSGGVAELATTDVAYEAWFRKYELDLNDPKMLDADPDGDGYNNREEFLSDTNPKDANSRPGVHSSIRLKDYTEVKVPFMLRSVQGDSARIEHEEGGDQKVETVRAGQPLRGSNFKVARVESVQTQDKDGNPIDSSRVTLEDAATAQKLELVKDLPARSTASFATLTSPDGKTTITVKQGDTFLWPGEEGASYRVVDLRNDQVIVEQVENKKMWTIPKK